MHNKLTRLSLATTSIFAAAALVACGGGGSDPVPTPPAQMGKISASLTDAPACGFDEVNVTVTKVRVHASATAEETAAGWTDITPAAPIKVNLLDLTNGSIAPLGTASLPVGKYTQVRLVLDPNTGTGMANSVKPSGSADLQPLETPSAVQSGLKLTGSFDITADQTTDLVIDFDACKSVLTKGNGKYALKPVIKLIPTVLNGISGFVPTALLASKPMVSAQQNGVVISSTVPDATGKFFLSRLVPGNYDVVLTADGSAASVIGAVPVASTTSTTTLSTAAAPITLATSLTGSISGTVLLSPVSATEAAYVAAKQAFAAGPTVTIKYAGADLATGAYTIANLPVTAPQYAAYSATLPLAFAAAATVTPGVGIYTVDASATGYVTKPFATPVNITAANAVNVDFTLTP